MSETATAETAPATEGEQAAPEAEAKEKRPQAGMYISTPEPLKSRIEQEASPTRPNPKTQEGHSHARFHRPTSPAMRGRSDPRARPIGCERLPSEQRSAGHDQSV
jgi:hypothetical protein